jgi:hypothetical protein
VVAWKEVGLALEERHVQFLALAYVSGRRSSRVLGGSVDAVVPRSGQ